MTPDDAERPAKSLEVYVSGTFDPEDEDTLNAIAQAILDSAPGGIEIVSTAAGDRALHGEATDQNGTVVQVAFSLPNLKWVWLWIDLTRNTEQTFPVNGTSAVRDALVAFGAGAQVSDDVILIDFYGPIASVPGIRKATIYAVVTDPNPVSPPDKPGSPADQDDPQFAIAGGSLAVYDPARITVVMA